MERFPRFVAVVGGLVTLALGLWAFSAPRSFFAHVALFPPFNRHLIHDVGAFLIGIGAMLWLAALLADGLLAALTGAAAGFVTHGVGHVLDRGLGGRSSDPVSLNVVAALFVVAAFVRWRTRPTA